MKEVRIILGKKENKLVANVIFKANGFSLTSIITEILNDIIVRGNDRLLEKNSIYFNKNK